MVSRYIEEPITVHVSRELRPTAFIWRKRLYHISEILSWWREPSEWWNGEPVRLLIRITAECTRPGTYEICKRDSDWFLHRLLD